MSYIFSHLDGYNAMGKAAQAVKLYMQGLDTCAYNAAQVGTVAGKTKQAVFTIFNPLLAENLGKIEGKIMNNFTEVGAAIPSCDNPTNLALNCCSYFLVKDSLTGALGHTRVGTFDWNKDLIMANHLQQKMQVVVRDPITGIIPNTVTNFQDFDASNLTSPAKASSSITSKLQLPGNANVNDNYQQILNVYDSIDLLRKLFFV